MLWMAVVLVTVVLVLVIQALARWLTDLFFGR